MNALAALGLGSLKVMLMLLVATGIALSLRQRPARLRAVVWGTALVGSLSLSWNVSSGSSNGSSVTVTETDWLVSPGAKRSVPVSAA